MREQHIEYRDGETLLEGFLCYDESLSGPRPTVLINHASNGRDEFVERKARWLAWQCYVSFTLYNYSKGKLGRTPEETNALMAPYLQNRSKLLTRIHAGLDVAKGLPIVDEKRVAVMGFCFGGLFTLDHA